MRVGIAGTGLIGSSIGQGLRSGGTDVVGWDPDPDVLALARSVEAIDRTAGSENELLSGGLDLVILAGPPRAVTATVASLDEAGLDPATLVMDVAGVKVPVISAVPDGCRFVGTHPMAGRERSGPEAASPALFRGAAWVVCGDGASVEDTQAVEAVVVSLGGRVVQMTAAEHDEAVAMVSHLPQVLAAVLMTEATDRTSALDLAAGSFRDLTRVAASEPSGWVELLAENASQIKAAVADLSDRLAVISAMLEHDETQLSTYLEAAQASRRQLAPPVVAVRVALSDQPGEIARVGRALEASSVDLRDLQLRHAPHGGGGVLTLSVRPGEAEPLRAALLQQGLLLAT
ncbi:MAG: prephenate dehydrogenase [Acidimicrobiia bacterium]